jgi:ELWxxDGT repeat protein
MKSFGRRKSIFRRQLRVEFLEDRRLLAACQGFPHELMTVVSQGAVPHFASSQTVLAAARDHVPGMQSWDQGAAAARLQRVTELVAGNANYQLQPDGNLLAVNPYVISPIGSSKETRDDPSDSGVTRMSPFPLDQTFSLNSLPGASKTIYLDFDGHTTSNTSWNSTFTSGAPIVTPPFSMDGSNNFSDIELERIQRIWERVSEDFLPFHVNVTTQEPPLHALRRSGTGDTQWGIRVVIGPDTFFPTAAGGVAFIGSFTASSDTPTFVFSDALGNQEKAIAEAASHEVGHTLGLFHDGNGSNEYYTGHGSGATGWAPIMGVGYNRELVQWSRGEYPGATNTENDLQIITTFNGFGYRADDHGTTIATATPLSIVDSVVFADGIIERTTDVDYFSFTTSGGNISLNINPFYRSPNLDILARLYDASGAVIGTSNPTNSLNASFNLTLDPGNYAISIEGTGRASSGSHLGYSDYGSLGYFSIQGTVPGGDISPLRDINSVPNTAASGVQGEPFVNVNGTLFFVANDGVNGSELWKSDGTAAGTVLVRDIRPGPGSSLPASLTNVNGILYFRADDGISGAELWRSDGTAAGTVIVQDLRVGIGSSSPDQLTNVDGTLFFSANDGNSGTELWRVTGSGPVELVSGPLPGSGIFPGGSASNPDQLTNVSGSLYFSATDGIHGRELWKVDPQGSAEMISADGSGSGIHPGAGSSWPGQLTNVRGTLFFTADDGANGSELWKTDGTIEGTQLVRDILPGAVGSLPNALTNVGGTLYFTADNGAAGFELWKSDGTAAGTVMVKDIRPGTSGSQPENLTNVGGSLYFSATDGISGFELWKSDGTPEGTVLVQDIRPGAGDSSVNWLTNVGGTLYFTASEATNGIELWRSDGTPAGTELVMDIANGSQSSLPLYLTVTGNHLFFSATTATFGRELYALPVSISASSSLGNFVYHPGSGFAISGIENALDTVKQLAKEGPQPQTLTYDNLLNSSRGINGLVFDFLNLPSDLNASDFEFRVSPTGAFIEENHPPASWELAPAPSSIEVVSDFTDRVILQWPDNAIANRWLRITVKSNENTGLSQPEVYYIGHLLGESTGPTNGQYTVSFADISFIRANVGESVDAGGLFDIDKNGTVAFADISAMRANIGGQLTNITIGATSGGSGTGQGGGPLMLGRPGSEDQSDPRKPGSTVVDLDSIGRKPGAANSVSDLFRNYRLQDSFSKRNSDASHEGSRRPLEIELTAGLESLARTSLAAVDRYFESFH